MAALLALIPVPMLDNRAVTQVPIFMPSMMGRAASMEMSSLKARACSKPMEALLLWITAVTTNPATVPNNLLRPKVVIMFVNNSESLSGSMATDIRFIPINSIPNPVSISPICLYLLRVPNSKRPTPTATTTGAISVSLKATIWAVTVVPILAPIITPTACIRFISPAFTKPTTITVVALLLWIMAVITAPNTRPNSLLVVSISSSLLSLSPAAF
jgi:hypothetical protein